VEEPQFTEVAHTTNLAATKSEELPPTIACIDDSILVYKNLEKILLDSGYRCYGIQDPLKIIPALIKNKPDLIFLDLVMPVTNGYEVCEQIRKTPSLANIPVVILTGSDGLIDRVRSKFVGANGFIGKPATAESVHKALDKYLDKKPVATAAKPLRAKRVEPPRSEPVLDRAKRVLVVDDDTNIREVVSVCLRKLKGWDTLTVGSGQEGLNSISTYQPDAIVLDMMMPLMDGLTFLRLLRSDPNTKLIPVVLMTANLYLPGKQLLTELGVVDIISKPFVPVNLVKQIDRVFA
jgi:two-component system, chemotaxis family, response regulator PixG